MAQVTTATSPDKKIGDLSIRLATTTGGVLVRPAARDSDSICFSVDNIQSTDHLKVFMSFLCDKQATDLTTAIRSSIELFKYCIPSRGAVLTFYSDLFSEYSLYYWINKKRSLTTPVIVPTSKGDQQQARTKIDYVGELTRRFFDVEKLRLADAREDQMSDFGETNLPAIQNSQSSPSKSIASHLTGPDSPTASCSHMSPTHSSSTARPIPTTGPREIPTSRRTSSCHSNDVDQTPMSPSTQEAEVNLDDNTRNNQDGDTIDIFAGIENLIPEIRSTFETIIEKYKLTEPAESSSMDSHDLSSFDRRRENSRNLLTNWATELLIQMNVKHSDIAVMLAREMSGSNQSNLLAKSIGLWTDNPINKLVIDLIIRTHNNINQFFRRISLTAGNCDWLLAYVLLEMSKMPNYDRKFASCMEYIIGGSCGVDSLTYILAYLSDNNPKAMTNFPKSNIPFLISLCQTSASLLNVLALEIPDQLNPEFVNNLAKEVFHKMPSQNHQSCIEGLTHCIIAAPNSYKLFLLSFDVMSCSEVGSDVKSATQMIIDSILLKIKQHIMQGVQAHNSISQDSLAVVSLLNQINSDPTKIIEKSTSSIYVAKKAIATFHLMSLLYGNMFASQIIAHYLNLPERSCWPLLKPLMKQFIANFGDDGSTLVSRNLSSDFKTRSENYWINLYNLTIAMPQIKLDLDLIAQLMVDKLCAATLDINSTSHLIKLCCNSLEKVDHARIHISTKHKLCMSLATCFFLLLEIDGDNFPEILSYIRVTLTSMSLLRQSSVASHILCRALLERSLVYGHLFNENFNPDVIGDELETADWTRDETVKLSEENLKVSLGHRFRRLPTYRAGRTHNNRRQLSNGNPNDPDAPNRQSINSYLLIEAFKSSITNIDAFANLFVEFHCPVMFDKNVWPSDESLRVINERNLGILRRFEQVPPFWDLFELIGQSKCLKNCLVLVKALLAAHLAMWASATTKSCPDKTISTARLIPPLAQSDLVPKAFGLTVDVFPHLSSGEVFSVLSDIWQYLKDTNMNSSGELELTREEKRLRAKTYLNRLRLFMCQHLPGPTYVKIFKDFYRPTPKTIPT